MTPIIQAVVHEPPQKLPDPHPVNGNIQQDENDKSDENDK